MALSSCHGNRFSVAVHVPAILDKIVETHNYKLHVMSPPPPTHAMLFACRCCLDQHCSGGGGRDG